jgi:hypothetical protein
MAETEQPVKTESTDDELLMTPPGENLALNFSKQNLNFFATSML